MLECNEDITILKNGYKIIQKKEGFRFSVDAVLLADFFLPTKLGKVLDIGTGTAIIAILIAIKEKGNDITGIDIQDQSCDLARRNVALNNLENKIKIYNCDIKRYPQGNTFDYIVSNPPYMKIDGKKQNEYISKSIARHEVELTLEELVKNAKRLLKPIGTFTLIHRSYRFTEICRVLEDSGFSLKRVRFVHFSREKNSNLVLIEAVKGKKCKLEIEPPVYLEESGY
ncbi:MULTISPECIES: methyltransferase [Fusobacterium]|jgi:tRNA1Val (adenine37-N6)-methyltransferase|uniref:Methyltransferase n=1 Tax=Fusobacterium hominis TaxID=2764326 RepID=A0A7G9GYY5_9FUSO|nr:MULTISPECIES: methyltransferase [Fusobacterium]QNM16017.1 methyltransferase [Fusobacterium hominis]